MTKIPTIIMILCIGLAVPTGCERLGGPDTLDTAHPEADATVRTVEPVWAAILSSDAVDDDATELLIEMPVDRAREARYRPGGGSWNESTMSLVLGDRTILLERADFEPVALRIKEAARRRGGSTGDQILLGFEALLEGITESSGGTAAVPLWITAMSLRSDALDSLADPSSVKAKADRLRAEVRRRMEISPYELLNSSF